MADIHKECDECGKLILEQEGGYLLNMAVMTIRLNPNVPSERFLCKRCLRKCRREMKTVWYLLGFVLLIFTIIAIVHKLSVLGIL